jgi:hypothetical protein
MRRSILVMLFALAGCSTIVGSSTQEIAVHTPGTGGADCVLTTDDGRVYTVTTPGVVAVDKSADDLHVHCRKQGYRDSVGFVGSEFDMVTLGNVANAGLGVPVDAATGAMHHYPNRVNVFMHPKDDKFISFLPFTETARWVGQGERGSCGMSWAADVRLNGDEVSGSLWRDQVEYALAGRIDPNGQLRNMPAGRSPASFGRPGPRFIRVNLHLNVDEASGSYSIDETGQLLCTTQIVLTRGAG